MAKDIDSKPEKRSNAATRFKPGNQYRFTAGEESPSPGGSESKYRLLSKALRERLAARAPDSVCETYKLPLRSSWAQVHAASISVAALRGDTSASRLIADLTGDSVRHQLDVKDGDRLVDELTGRFTSVNFPHEDFLTAAKLISDVGCKFPSAKALENVLHVMKKMDDRFNEIEFSSEFDGQPVVLRVGNGDPMFKDEVVRISKNLSIREAVKILREWLEG